ncbi:MAG: monovalent cation/H+ antiporter complex subunit F [Thermomicrobiales bacterium]
MDLTLFAGAMIWMTWLLAAVVIFAIKAPSNAVRILALDAMTLVLVAVLVLFSASRQEEYYMDAALALALVSFVASVGASRWLAAGRIL